MKRVFALAATSVVLFLGCQASGTPLPKTFPVKGKVVDAKGSPLTEGMVQFESTSDTNLTVAGPIQGDGSFMLKSYRDRQEQTGVPEGEYRATITLPIKTGNAPPPPVIMKATYRVEAKENHFDLQIGK